MITTPIRNQPILQETSRLPTFGLPWSNGLPSVDFAVQSLSSVLLSSDSLDWSGYQHKATKQNSRSTGKESNPKAQPCNDWLSYSASRAACQNFIKALEEFSLPKFWQQSCAAWPSTPSILRRYHSTWPQLTPRLHYYPSWAIDDAINRRKLCADKTLQELWQHNVLDDFCSRLRWNNQKLNSFFREFP